MICFLERVEREKTFIYGSTIEEILIELKHQNYLIFRLSLNFDSDPYLRFHFRLHLE